MKKLLLFIFAFSFLAFSSLAQTILYEDDFESYTIGGYLAVQSDDWTTWENSPGTAEDAFIVDEQSNSPSKSVEVEGSTDLVLPLGDKVTGKYELLISMYVVAGNSGYYNLQHYEAPGTEWALEVYFADDGTGTIAAGGADAATFNYTQDTWVTCQNIVNIDTDTAQLYIDGVLIHEWLFSTGANGNIDVSQLGGLNVYAGGPTGQTPHFYFDDVVYTELESGIGSAQLSYSPDSFSQILKQGHNAVQTLTIENGGAVDMEYEMFLTFSSNNPVKSNNPSIVENDYVNNQTYSLKLNKNETHIDASPSVPTNEPTIPTKDDVLLHYDGDNSTAIGWNIADASPRVAAKFTTDMINQYIGLELTAIELYINDPALNYKTIVYDFGEWNFPAPGNLVNNETFNANEASWNTIPLSQPYAIEGGDLWVGYQFDQPDGNFPAGCDAGPADPNGDWTSNGPGWSHLSANPDLDNNWNIRAFLSGTPLIQWFNISNNTGTVLANGGSEDITLNFDATGLDVGDYNGKIILRTTDPDNKTVEIPVFLGATVGVDNITVDDISIYPNPANNYFKVEAEEIINEIVVYNCAGQVVDKIIVNDFSKEVNITQYDSGIYVLELHTNKGVVTSKIAVR